MTGNPTLDILVYIFVGLGIIALLLFIIGHRR